ncbi:MAG: hypothetical protein R3Y11_01775 [Pseudomonadota bacterium]
MPSLVVSQFAGCVPIVGPRLLESYQASYAENCNIERGTLQAMRKPLLVESLDNKALAIFKHDSDGWLSFGTNVNVVKSAVIDIDGTQPLGQLIITGGDYPVQYLAGGDTYRLGIPRPTSAPMLAIVDVERPDDEEAAGDDGEIERSTSYCYTFVQKLADDVIQYESAPSPPTDVVDVLHGYVVRVGGFLYPDLEKLEITHVRIYRTVSGTETTEFRYVTELEVTGVADDDIFLDDIYDMDVSSEVLATDTWDAIPDNAQGLIKTDYGIYAAFRGNELLISEPYIPYAFPESYYLTVEDSIVALGHMDGVIAVLTTGRPYLLEGQSPDTYQMMHLPIEQACVSPQSVAMSAGSLIYASPDGLMFFSVSEQSIMTGNIFSREQWQALGPENLMATMLDGRYVGFFKGTNKGLSYDISRGDIVHIVLPDEWLVHGMYHHSEDDCIYLSVQTDFATGGHGVWKFEAGDELLPYVWKSKEFFSPSLVNMSAVRVQREESVESGVLNDTVIMEVSANTIVKASIPLQNGQARRIPITSSARVWSFTLTGTGTVYEARLGTSIGGIEYGT